MTLQPTTVTFDCEQALRVASFWAAALELAVDEGATDSFATITSPTGQLNLAFVAVPETKLAKNRVHLDLGATDRTKEVERLIKLGATRHSDHDEGGIQWTTLLDVEGNELCIA
jgi:hypothetical protein